MSDAGITAPQRVHSGVQIRNPRAGRKKTPAVKARIADAIRRKWQDPVYRAKTIASIKESAKFRAPAKGAPASSSPVHRAPGAKSSQQPAKPSQLSDIARSQDAHFKVLSRRLTKVEKARDVLASMDSLLQQIDQNVCLFAIVS